MKMDSLNESDCSFPLEKENQLFKRKALLVPLGKDDFIIWFETFTDLKKCYRFYVDSDLRQSNMMKMCFLVNMIHPIVHKCTGAL